jgi:Leucine-rich repeat (LRR) protein
VQAKTGRWQAIKKWVLRSQRSLCGLPDSIAGLSSLQYLELYRCSHLKALSDAVVQLPKLQELHLRYCTGLQVLSTDLGLMQSLEVLDLKGCSSLSALPGGIGRLHNLRKLNLRDCSKLEKLPPSIWDLTGLQSYEPPRDGGVELPERPPMLHKLKPALETKNRFTVLSIDGGGMRGLIPGESTLVIRGCHGLR